MIALILLLNPPTRIGTTASPSTGILLPFAARNELFVRCIDSCLTYLDGKIDASDPLSIKHWTGRLSTIIFKYALVAWLRPGATARLF